MRPADAFSSNFYVVKILDSHRTHADAKLPLPVVIPVVLHHSDRGWTAATSIQQLFDPDLASDAGIAPFVPHLQFVLDDVSHLSDDQLRGRAQQLFPKVVLWALRDARDANRFMRSLTTWASALDELALSPSGLDAFQVVLRYIAVVCDVPTRAVIDVIEKYAPHSKESLMSLAQRWIDEGIEKGIEKGRAKGRADTLIELLSLKFGPLPNEVRMTVGAASEEELARWTAALLTSTSLGEALR